MKNRTSISSLVLRIITFILILLWVPVFVDKIWNLTFFRNALLQQPFPKWWADILFWLLPLIELGVVILLIWPKEKLLHIGMWASFLLLSIFTLYIGVGVAGLYEQKPCGCGSVIKGLSWNQHLVFNLFFLALSLAGIYFKRQQDNITQGDVVAGWSA